MTWTQSGTRWGTRIAGAVIALGAAIALLGCAGGGASDTGNEPSEEGSSLSGNLTVFAAASLEPAFEKLSARFTEQNPDVSFDLTFDGSSVLATQILSGAPTDVYASADEPNMLKITDEGLNVGEPMSFATSELAIAVTPGNPFGIDTLADLTETGPDGRLPVTVVCTAEVPCGNASHALLDRDGVDLEPASEEQNVTGVLTKVREGEADAGLVYLSDILRAEGEVEGIPIENASEAAGDYLIVPIQGSALPEAALAFSEFLTSHEAKAVFTELGFGPAH